MCQCRDIEPGSYDAEIIVSVPENITLRYNAPGQKPRKTVCIDICLLAEIVGIWSLGIRTTGCCCGHNKIDGYIGVVEEDIPKMLALGYRHRPNPMYPEREDEFYPKLDPKLPEKKAHKLYI